MVYQGNHGFIAWLSKENSEALTKEASRLSILINFERYIYCTIAKSSIVPKSVKKTKIKKSTFLLYNPAFMFIGLIFKIFRWINKQVINRALLSTVPRL